MLAAVNFYQMDKEQELQEIAELLMQSENLAASVKILRQFADKCWQEGACEAQNDAAKYINEHNILFTNGGCF